MKILDLVILLLSVGNAQKNLSHDGTPSQSTTFEGLGAHLAVTGGPTNDFNSLSCAITGANQYTVWWMLAFPGNTTYFTNVNIFYRSNTLYRLAGYSLYVTNTSVTTTSPKPTNGHLCFHHTGTTLPSMNQSVDCNVRGQYIVIYNERNKTASDNTDGYSSRAWLELCDVQIYGCYKGWWDSSCSTPCPVNCIVDHCYPGNGSCVWGCNRDNCLNDICDTVTGKCTEGCKSGLLGDYCDKQCSVGKYGYNCNQSCDGCLSDSCDENQGVCTNTTGCKPGWRYIQSGKQMCDIECSVGKYGYNCNQSCDGCLSDSCDKKQGVCTNTTGCKPGWRYIQSGQQMCNIACDDGYFGMNCAHQCYCRYGACNKATGICHTKGCQQGWKGDTCSEACSAGDHGFDCAYRCGTCNYTLCERFEGNCTHGCMEGLKGHQCLVSVTPQSDGQTTKDNACTMNIIYAVIGTFIGNTLVCVIIFLAILRYLRGKTDGDAKKENRQTSREYVNSTFTNDYVNIGSKNAEMHYEETIPSAQEQTYDII